MSVTETCSRVRVGKNVSDRFPIRSGLKQGDALSPLLFNFALEYAIRRVQGNQDVVCILLSISPASYCCLPTFRNPLSVPSSRAGCRDTLHPALEDGTDRGFRNVGKQQLDAGEIPKRIHTIFKTRRKFEIKNY